MTAHRLLNVDRDWFGCSDCGFKIQTRGIDIRLLELQHQVEVLQSQILVITAELSQ